MIRQFTGRTVQVDQGSNLWSASGGSDIALYDSFSEDNRDSARLTNRTDHAQILFSDEDDEPVIPKNTSTTRKPGEFLSTMLNISDSNSVDSGVRQENAVPRDNRSLNSAMARADSASFLGKEETKTDNTISIMSGVMGMFCMPRTAPREVEETYTDKYTSKEALYRHPEEDALDRVCNHVESMVCRDAQERFQSVDARDRRIIKKYYKPEKDVLDHVFENIEAAACRDDTASSSIHRAKVLYKRDLLDNVCEHVEYAVCREDPENNGFRDLTEWPRQGHSYQKAAVRPMVPQNHDMLDHVCENVEGVICRPETQKYATMGYARPSVYDDDYASSRKRVYWHA